MRDIMHMWTAQILEDMPYFMKMYTPGIGYLHMSYWQTIVQMFSKQHRLLPFIGLDCPLNLDGYNHTLTAEH